MPQEKMPTDQERRLSTLIFETPREAQEFSERVGEKSRQASSEGVTQQREILAEEIAAEMTKHGESATVLNQPWEHTAKEHQEVQKLVDLAFLEDLPTALKRAKKSQYYPRIIDLLHDVLTSEMYEAIARRKLNRQKIINWQAALALIIMAILVIASLFAAAVL